MNKMKPGLRRALWLIPALVALAAAAFLIFGGKGGQPSHSLPAGVNLLAESSFSALEQGAGAWYEDAYVLRPEYTEFSFAEGRDGGVCGHIVNKIGNDARFAQDVEVDPDSLYCLSGWIRADCREGLGANLSVAGVYAFSEPLYDTQGDWTHVTFYGRTGPEQSRITVYARLGGYSGEAEGEAWFDQISLVRLDEAPAGAAVARWFDDTPQAQDETPAQTPSALLPSLALGFFALLYLLLILLCLSLRPAGRKVPALPAALVLFAAGLAVRLVLMGTVRGYDVDVGDFCAWAQNLLDVGPSRFYTQAGFCDYPPGYILILGLFALPGRLAGTGVTEALIKLPPVVCDLLGAFLLLRCALRQDGVSPKEKKWPLSALLPAALYLMNPMVLLTGAGWGQSDGVMMLFLLLTVLWAIDGKWHLALPAYVAAVLVKPQALMFGPLGLAALAVCWYPVRKDKKALRRMASRFLAGAGIAAALALAVILPFKGEQPLGWLIALYQRTMSFYASATVNACNLYFLIGANWVGTETAASFLYPLLCGGLTALTAGLALIRLKRVRALRIACLAVAGAGALCMLTALFPLPYQTYSTAGIVLCVGLILFLFWRSGSLKRLPLYGGALLALLFNVGGMMHERYLFAALPLLALAWYLEKDDRLLPALGGLTVSSFLNAGCVLSRNTRIGGASGHLSAPQFHIVSDMAVLEYAAAVLSVLGAMYCLYLAFRAADPAWQPVCLRRAARAAAEDAPAEARALPDETKDWLPAHRMDRKDWLILLSVTAVYALLAFFRLGSPVSPQTGYMFTETDETVTFDLGRHTHDFRMLYIGGVHQFYRDFTVSVSDDGENWDKSFTCDMDIGGLFQWTYVRTWEGKNNAAVSGRYVRITGRPGLNLYEFLFWDQNGAPIRPVSAVSSTGADVSALTDEPSTLTEEPGWYNSMYFDEIYHARTAYEHLTGLNPYETTHPPLGKVLMSGCIALFGMTPFGWRFAGTLCGVLMLPGMYLLGRLLFRKRRFAVLSVLLMALDTMHYTQTRLATIDSFVVLFIIWAYYFMLRWFFTDPFGKSFSKTLLPLGLSGLFMGLAVASKWTGCYAGVGLAALFFTGLWRRWRLIRRAKAQLDAQTDEAGAPPPDLPDRALTAARAGTRRLLLTLLSCVLFFVIVPLGVYYLSYIPYFAPSGGVTVRKIIDAANGMLSYHSQPGLGMDHPFYSPWYEWPFSVTPMYYAADGFEPAGYASSILAFGNPAVWWTGFAALLAVLYALARHQALPLLSGSSPRRNAGPFCPAGERDVRPLLLILSFAAQYLPWMLVPRGTYIYHYFPSVPFIILDTALIGEYLTDWLEDRAARKALREGLTAKETAALSHRTDRRALFLLVVLPIALAAALFAALFPYASGLMVRTEWLNAVNWFGNLYY